MREQHHFFSIYRIIEHMEDAEIHAVSYGKGSMVQKTHMMLAGCIFIETES